MRRWVAIVLAVAVIAAVGALATAFVGGPTTSDVAPEEDATPALVPLETGQQLWPYHSSSSGDFERRSAINVVVYAPLEEVVAVLSDDGEWFETAAVDEDAGSASYSAAELDLEAPEEALGWGQATGTDRYAYMEVDGEGHWLDESAQLHDGDYYGSRSHLRLYEAPGGDPSVAIQAHDEYFDWFTLRHTVTSIEQSQYRVEADLLAVLGEQRVWRQRMGNGDVRDADGWVTFAASTMVSVVGLAGLVAPTRRRLDAVTGSDLYRRGRRRLSHAHLLLFVATVGLLLGTRLLGIGLERLTDWHTYWIAGLGFPLVGLGLPVVAYLLGRRLERRMDAAMSASLGLAVAVLIDFHLLGVHVLPIETILHRGGLVIALGLVAAGGAGHDGRDRAGREFLLAGGTLWVALVALSLSPLL